MPSLEEIQDYWYKTHDNYLIEITNNQKDTVAIYFCSNNLFFPHTIEEFEKSVVMRNRFEWYRQRVKRASKHIFVRDIYKQWYATGLNSKIPDVDAMFCFLKEECMGFGEIITVGSSAGGYASILFGTMLKANICFSFNAQWELYSSIKINGRIVSPKLYELYRLGGARYMDIAKPEFDKNSVFYFVSTESPWDIKQNEHASNMQHINRLYFATSHHGIPFLKVCLKELLQLNREQLMALSGKKYHPVLFSFMISGIMPSLKYMIKEIWKKKFKKR